jgi:hypothetical protein
LKENIAERSSGGLVNRHDLVFPHSLDLDRALIRVQAAMRGDAALPVDCNDPKDAVLSWIAMHRDELEPTTATTRAGDIARTASYRVREFFVEGVMSNPLCDNVS